MIKNWFNQWFNQWFNSGCKECESHHDDLIEIEKGSGDAAPDESPQSAHSHSQDQQLMMEKALLHLCQDLAVSSRGFETSIEQWLQDLDKYIDNYERLLYSSISNYIYALDDDKRPIFEMNTYLVFQHVMNQACPKNASEKAKYENRKRIVTKFYDHVNLAQRQFVLFSQKQADVEAIVEKKIEPKLAASSKELTSQLVGLVAIFTALSFIVFGGISSLESLFSILSQNGNSVLPTIIVAIAWAFCLMNLLFAFMYFVLRVMGSKPDTTEKEPSLIQQYSPVFIINYILLAAFLLSLGSWAAWVTGAGKGIYDAALSHGDLIFVIGLIIIVAIIAGLGLWLIKSLKHPK